MRRRLPPLKALPSFELVARHLSFSAAAENLHLTHGAISRQIKALETHLGVPLFRRLSRRVELTECGARFLPAVRTALDVLETSAARISGQPRHDALVISCLPTFMMRWLIPRLYDFNARHPGIDVRLSASYAPINFARDGIDVAIRFGPAARAEGLEAQAFLKEEFGPVCSASLPQRRRLTRPADLRHHTLLHTDSRLHAWTEWVRRSGIKGIDHKSGPRFEHFYFLLEAAASGLGVAVAPRPLVADDIRIGRLVAPFGFRPSGQSYCLVYPRELGGSAKIEAFRSWIVNVAVKQAFGGSMSPEPKPPLE